MVPFEQGVGEFGEAVCFGGSVFEGIEGEAGMPAGFFTAFVESPEGDGGEFMVLGITAGGFSEDGGGLGGIEYVVEDLKGESEMMSVLAEAVDMGGACAGGDGTDAAGTGDEAGGFFGVDVEKPGFIGREIFGGEIFDLTADDAG